MSDRIAIFNGGRIEQIAAPRALYEGPSNIFVAGFVGDNNLLAGQVVERRGADVRVEIPGSGFVIARAGDIDQAGPGTVAIRPEKLSLVSAESPAGDENRLGGVVESVIYFGDSAKIVVRLPGEQTLAVKTGTDILVGLGDSVVLRWDHENAIAFRPSATFDA